MMVTEEEARKKWCPFAGKEGGETFCLASSCMMWRQVPTSSEGNPRLLEAWQLAKAGHKVKAINAYRKIVRCSPQIARFWINDVEAGREKMPRASDEPPLGYCGLSGMKGGL